jgi:hypothetical protein
VIRFLQHGLRAVAKLLVSDLFLFVGFVEVRAKIALGLADCRAAHSEKGILGIATEKDANTLGAIS